MEAFFRAPQKKKGVFMKLKKLLGVVAVMGTLVISACGGNGSNSSAKPNPGSSSRRPSTSTSIAPRKSVSIGEISLTNEEGKAYVKVTGTVANYTAAEFKWAWGLKINGDSGAFVDGKESPTAEDYKAAEFDATSKAFTLKYNLTDLELTSGAFYQVYGGTPETYANIAFENTAAATRDATRNYYLRTDQQNSIVFDSIQPINFSKASVVNIEADDLPAGVTVAGPYLKFGGVNEANLTMDTIDEWAEAGKIAGNFQRVIGGDYTLHDHVNSERFWKIEGEDVYFYCSIGFIASGEGWQTHFDCVSGNSGANLQFEDTTFWGDADHTYVFGEDTYKVYADKAGHGGSEAGFWGCLGVTRNAEA